VVFHAPTAKEWAERLRVPGLKRFHRFDIVVVIQYDRDIIPLALNLAIDHRIPTSLHNDDMSAFVLEHVMQ